MANQQVNMKMVPFYLHGELGREIAKNTVQGELRSSDLRSLYVSCICVHDPQVSSGNKEY